MFRILGMLVYPFPLGVVMGAVINAVLTSIKLTKETAVGWAVLFGIFIGIRTFIWASRHIENSWDGFVKFPLRCLLGVGIGLGAGALVLALMIYLGGFLGWGPWFFGAVVLGAVGGGYVFETSIKTILASE